LCGHIPDRRFDTRGSSPPIQTTGREALALPLRPRPFSSMMCRYTSTNPHLPTCTHSQKPVPRSLSQGNSRMFFYMRKEHTGESVISLPLRLILSQLISRQRPLPSRATPQACRVYTPPSAAHMLISLKPLYKKSYITPSTETQQTQQTHHLLQSCLSHPAAHVGMRTNTKTTTDFESPRSSSNDTIGQSDFEGTLKHSGTAPVEPSCGFES
jgi:hypothetical protein